MVTTQEQRIDDLRATEEWLLLIFDALRYDTLDHYVENGSVEEVTSPATGTSDWMQQVWDEEYDACYVSGAPLTGDHDHSSYTGEEHFTEMIQVWKDNWSEELRTVPPQPITEAALDALAAYDKVVVHYVQPHAPYIGTPRIICGRGRGDAPVSGGDRGERGVTETVRHDYERGELSQEDLYRAYYDNLVQVAEGARPLIEASDRRTVVTSDHGEYLGEHTIGHNYNCAHVRQVPWFEVL